MLPARLPDYERGRARYFYIVPRPGVETAGAILLNLDARDLAALDRYRSFRPLHSRGRDGNHRRRRPNHLLVPLPTQRVTGER